MIRRLIILLLIVGCVFAEDELLLLNGKSYKGEYIASVGESIVFKVTGLQKGESINLSRIQKIILEDGTKVYNNQEKEKFSFDNSIRIFGLDLITFGSGLLLVTLYKECGDGCNEDEWKDFVNERKLQNQIGFGLIAIGGILITIKE